MKIAVIGANGHTGRIVVRDALSSGHEVIAVARTHEPLETEEHNLTKARADVRDPDALTRALDGANAVVSALGVGTSRAPTDVYSTGVRNTLAAMRSSGATKLAVISAVPAALWAEQPTLQHRIALPILQRMFGATYDDTRRMEAILHDTTQLDWISLRPRASSTNNSKALTESIPGRWQRRAPSPTATSLEPYSVRTRPDLYRHAAYVAN